MSASSRKKKHLSAFLLLQVLLCSFFLHSAEASRNTSVILLHTLSPDDEWTRQATGGILSAFTAAGVPAEFFIEYMDITSTFWSSHVASLKNLLEAKFSLSPPALVIATGNEAVNFALAHAGTLFGGASVVFCGLSNEYLFSVFSEHWGTGVFSASAHELLLSEIGRLHPGAAVAFVSDLTPAGLRDLSRLNTSLARSQVRQKILPLTGLPRERLADSLSKLPPNAVIMLGSHSALPDGTPTSLRDTLLFISRYSSSPIYTLQEEGILFGATASVAGNGGAMGRKAGEMAVSILSGVPAEELPAEKSERDHLIFDYAMLKRHSIPRSALSAQAVIQNDPAEAAARYFPAALLYISLIVLVGSLALFLKKKIAKRKKTEKNLMERTEYWEQLFQRSPEGIVIYNGSGKILESNLMFRSTFALSEKDISEANITALLPWDKGTIRTEDFFPESRGENREVLIPDRDGILIPSTHLPFTLISGRDKIYCSIIQDISQRKEMENRLEEKSLFQETLSSISSRFILSPSYHDAMKSTLEVILTMAGAKSSVLFRLSGKKGILAPEITASSSPDAPSLKNLFPSEQEEDFFWKSLLFREGSFQTNTFKINGLPPTERKEWLPLEERGISSVYVLPLDLRGSFQGFLALADPSPDWERSSAEPVFDVLRNTLAAAIERDRDEASLERNHQVINERFTGAVLALCQVSELRDVSTSGHQKNVSGLAEALALKLGLPEETVLGIRYGGLVHDIGKLYIPAEILSKPSKLTPAEYELVKKHPEFGRDILSPLDFPWPLAEIILQHHERTDGTGYPRGLKKDEICIEARILSVADAFDAMTSDRPYRKKFSRAQAMEEIKSLSGRAYDPEVVKALEELLPHTLFQPASPGRGRAECTTPSRHHSIG